MMHHAAAFDFWLSALIKRKKKYLKTCLKNELEKEKTFFSLLPLILCFRPALSFRPVSLSLVHPAASFQPGPSACTAGPSLFFPLDLPRPSLCSPRFILSFTRKSGPAALAFYSSRPREAHRPSPSACTPNSLLSFSLLALRCWPSRPAQSS
jgi:hypothetical protein